jgi:hypothetical protein
LVLSQNHNSENKFHESPRSFSQLERGPGDKLGSINCTEPACYDLIKPEELAEARAKAVFISKCKSYIKTAVMILEEIM